MNGFESFIVSINEFLGELVHFGSSTSSQISLAFGLI